MKIQYVADDGTRFSTQEECTAYEKKMDLSMVPMLEWAHVETKIIKDCRYVYLKNEEATNRFLSVLDKFGISSHGIVSPGFYVIDPNKTWWESFDNEIKSCKSTINHLEEVSAKLLTMAENRGTIDLSENTMIPMLNFLANITLEPDNCCFVYLRDEEAVAKFTELMVIKGKPFQGPMSKRFGPGFYFYAEYRKEWFPLDNYIERVNKMLDILTKAKEEFSAMTDKEATE